MVYAISFLLLLLVLRNPSARQLLIDVLLAPVNLVRIFLIDSQERKINWWYIVWSVFDLVAVGFLWVWVLRNLAG